MHAHSTYEPVVPLVRSNPHPDVPRPNWKRRLPALLTAIAITVALSASTLWLGASSASADTDSQRFASLLLAHWGASLTGNSVVHDDLVAAKHFNAATLRETRALLSPSTCAFSMCS
jgi:hypothetical protein